MATEKGAGSQILTELAALHAKVDKLMAHLGATRAAQPQQGEQKTGRVAEPREIQGERGDPKIRMKPRDWSGEDYKGAYASQCPPDFLDVYANQLDWFATNQKVPDAQKAHYDMLDAARCRRWAADRRAGRSIVQDDVPPPPGDTTWDGGNASSGYGTPPLGDSDFGPPPGDDCPF